MNLLRSKLIACFMQQHGWSRYITEKIVDLVFQRAQQEAEKIVRQKRRVANRNSIYPFDAKCKREFREQAIIAFNKNIDFGDEYDAKMLPSSLLH